MSAERCNDEVYEKNPHILAYDWEYYNQLLPLIQGEVLDIGCGAGTFVREYAKKDTVTSVVAIDKYIDEMPEIDKVVSMQFVLPDELGVSKDSAKYDTIVSTEFIEHIDRDKLEPLLEKVKLLLKDDGVFVGSTPNKIAPTTNPYHLYEYTLEELLGIFQNHFSIVDMHDNGQFCTIWKAKR